MRAVLLGLLLLAGGGAEAGPPVTGGYFAIIVADVETSASWYTDTLGLERRTRLTEPGRYDIINLEGPGIAVELLQLASALERPDGRLRGAFKVGFLVADLDAFVASLPHNAGSPRIIEDETNGLRILQLRDPDNTIVQVMQLSTERADAGTENTEH